jgi:hypothetical protein
MPRPSQYASIYYNPTDPSGYSSANKLRASLPGASVKKTKEWLQTQDTYTLHKPARKKLASDQIIVSGIDDQWESDLVDVHEIAHLNKGYTFLLTVIDVLSKYAWVVPLKNKTGKATREGLHLIFKKGRTPRFLRTDAGKEFQNRPVQALLRQYNVKHFLARNRVKAGVVERFNRTLRSKLWKYFYATGKQRYVDVLQDFVASYNATVHSVTKMAPKDVTAYNGETVWRTLYGHLLTTRNQKKKKPRFKVGDVVRISRQKPLFEKGYKASWVEELFTVHSVTGGRVGSQYRYHIKDESGEIIEGSFKEEELQKVKPTVKTIKKTVKTTPKERLVQWTGYPATLATWIPR